MWMKTCSIIAWCKVADSRVTVLEFIHNLLFLQWTPTENITWCCHRVEWAVCVCVYAHVWLMDNVAGAGVQRSVAVNYYMLLSGGCRVAHSFVKAHFPSAASERPQLKWLSLNKLRVELVRSERVRPRVRREICNGDLDLDRVCVIQ